MNRNKTFFKAAVVFFVYAAATHALAPRSMYFEANNSIWHGNERGFYRFQPENEQWTLIKACTVNDLCFNDNTVYVGTGEGIWYADIRYLNWKVYQKAEGLAGDTILRIVTDADFVYAAGAHGISRLNKLVEQWENLGDFNSKTIHDMYSDQEYLWVATDAGVSVFEKRLESWKFFSERDGLLANMVQRLFFFSENLWAVTEKGFSLYNPNLKNWTQIAFNPQLCGSSVSQLQVDAEYIWTKAPEGVFRYSGRDKRWEFFSRNTQLERVTVNGITTVGKTVWFATDQGVYSYQEEQRRWTGYSAIEGLNDDVQQEIFSIGQTVISRTENIFNVYIPAEDLWRNFIPAGGGAKGSGGKTWERFSDERGTGVAFPDGKNVSLLGYAYFRVKNKADFPQPLWKSITDYILNKNLDSLSIPRFKDYLNLWLKAQTNAQMNLNNGRSIHGLYDNTDPLGSVHGGMEYQGNSEDKLKRLGFMTDQTSDFFYSTLIKPTYYDGGKIRAEFGRRIGEKKRKQINSNMYAGWRKTKYVKKLILFQEDNFYLLNINNIVTESVELIVDGRRIDSRDYSIERTRGILTFRNANFLTPDSRIEIAVEYEPALNEYTDRMAAMEHVLVADDQVSFGVTGLYRGFNEPDKIGTGTDTNHLFVGSASSGLEWKSHDGAVFFKAVPELSVSFNDSILVRKRGTAAATRLDAKVHRFSFSGQARSFSSQYETQAGNISIFGKPFYSGDGVAAFDILPYMPVSMRVNLLDAAGGKERRITGEYLVAKASWPSLKLGGTGYFGDTYKKRMRFVPPRDSVIRYQLGAYTEVEWDCNPQLLNDLHIEKLYANIVYGANLIADSTWLRRPADTLSVTPDSLSFEERFNHNFFSTVRFSPHKTINLETKQVFRRFTYHRQRTLPFQRIGQRYIPEFILFVQELIPGINLYGDVQITRSLNLFGPNDTDTTGSKKSTNINTKILLIPGVWYSVFNVLQINAGYNRVTEDSTKQFIQDSMVKIDPKSTMLGQTFSLNPILDFNLSARVQNKSEYIIQKNFGRTISKAVKSASNTEFYLNDRKTKGFAELAYTKATDHLRKDTVINNHPIIIDTITIKPAIDVHLQWDQRFNQNIRTQLPFKIGWQKTEKQVTIDTMVPINRYTLIQGDSVSAGRYINTFSLAALIDWRVQPSFLNELRTQYQTGFSFYNGLFFKPGTYTKSWDHKLDLSIKALKNLYFRMFLNMNYLFTERVLKYDLAEMKLTAMF